MNEAPTREEIVEFLTNWIMHGWWSDKEIRLLNKVIEYVKQTPKYRKKAKRFKNKYLKLKTAIGKIKAEIKNADAESFKNPDYHRGLLFALEIIDKYKAERSGEE